MTAKTYMVKWNCNGEGGFRSRDTAQQFIDNICTIVAPDINYAIAEEF